MSMARSEARRAIVMPSVSSESEIILPARHGMATNSLIRSRKSVQVVWLGRKPVFGPQRLWPDS